MAPPESPTRQDIPENVKLELDIQDILKCLPHRYPFLMVDRVTGVKDNRLHGFKNITYNEPCFTGHFPETPVFPGVLQIEALAQLGGLFAIQYTGLNVETAAVMLLSVDNVRFRKPIRPGDRMDLRAWLIRRKGPMWKMGGDTRVNDEVCCELELMAYVGPRDKVPLSR